MARAAFPEFGERLRGLFTARGITNQSEFARQNNFTIGKVNRWLSGSLPEERNDLERLAAVLGAPSWQWLLVGDEGIKAMGALSPRDPIVIKLDDRNFAVAMYQETENDVSVYEIKHRGLRTKTLATTYARTLKDDQKL